MCISITILHTQYIYLLINECTQAHKAKRLKKQPHSHILVLSQKKNTEKKYLKEMRLSQFRPAERSPSGVFTPLHKSPKLSLKLSVLMDGGDAICLLGVPNCPTLLFVSPRNFSVFLPKLLFLP